MPPMDKIAAEAKHLVIASHKVKKYCGKACLYKNLLPEGSAYFFIGNRSDTNYS